MPDPETPLSDAQHAIGQVIRLAESWRMAGGQLDAAHVTGALLVICAPWTGGLRVGAGAAPALPVAAELDGPEMPGQLPLPGVAQ